MISHYDTIIDLTIPLSHGMDAFPGEPTAEFTPFSSLSDGGIEMWNVRIFSQLGTHVDAPRHFIAGGRTVEALDLRKCIGPAAVVDVDPSRPLTANQLLGRKPDIQKARRVIIRSGHSSTLGTPSYWQHFPELELDAADCLVDWGVTFVGLDTPTPSIKHLHEVHKLLLGRGVVIAECLINVERLSSMTYLLCLPLPLTGLDGSPARIVALESR